MSYIVYTSSGTILTTIPTGKVNTVTTSLTLIGRDVTNYGRSYNQNLVNLLSNFANSTSKPPRSPLLGQIWYDTTYHKLKVYDGGFQVIGGALITGHQPAGQEPGEFWLDTSTNVLNFLDENGQYQSITSFPRSDVSGWKYPTDPIYNNNTASFVQQVTLLQSYGDILGALSADAFTASEYDSTSTFAKANTTAFDIAAGLTIIGDIKTTGNIKTNDLLVDTTRNRYSIAVGGSVLFANETPSNTFYDDPTVLPGALNSIQPILSFNGIDDNVGYTDGLRFNTTFLEDHIGPQFQFSYGGANFGDAESFSVQASSITLGSTSASWSLDADGTLTLPNGAVINSSAVSTSSVAYYNYDAASLTIDVVPSTTIDFPNFSGQILINDHFDGQVELWLAGGAYAYRLGTSKSGGVPQTLGDIAFNPGIQGYTWTSAVTGTMVFVATRTRAEA